LQENGMTRFGLAIATAASLGLLATPVSAEPKPVDSWGRAGVDYDTYSNDSVECALIGHYADVSETEQAQKFVTASRRLQTSDDHSMGAFSGNPSADAAANMYQAAQAAARNEQIRSSIRPAKLMKELQQGLVGVVEACLIERGYSQFRLTEGQAEALSELERGSDERRHFLHSLASDATVLEEQALPVAG
jgi:hypothetical protein